jgi:hypothetical protein
MENENEIETNNIESAMQKEVLIRIEYEKIELAEKKLCQKYSEYEELTRFIKYLSSMEKFFAKAKFYEFSNLGLKEELINVEVEMFGKRTSVGEEVLYDIRHDFHMVCEGIHNIIEVEEKLLEKYGNHPDCKEFILYLRDVTINLLEKMETGITIDEIKAHLYAVKMHQLSSDGDPEISVLEKIKAEFFEQLLGKSK